MSNSSDFLILADQPTRPLGRVIRDLDHPAAKGDVIQTQSSFLHLYIIPSRHVMSHNARPLVPTFLSFRRQQPKEPKDHGINTKCYCIDRERRNKPIHSERKQRHTHEHRGSHETREGDEPKLFVFDRHGDVNPAKYGPSAYSSLMNMTSSGTF